MRPSPFCTTRQNEIGTYIPFTQYAYYHTSTPSIKKYYNSRKNTGIKAGL